MRKIVSFLSALFLLSCGYNSTGQSSIKDSPLAGLMEIPQLNETDNIVWHTGYVSSYNTETLIPDWVAYELVSDELYGDADRNNCRFGMDPSFRKRQAMREDYSGTSWSKGHMAPAADFKWDEEAMEETFFFVNCCPQDRQLNSKDWNYLEKQVRAWSRKYGTVWVVTGPIVGENKYGKIGDRGVVVPDAFFKAVFVCQDGTYHSIGFVMKNDSSRQYLDKCACTVNDLEKLTGIDLFPNLDDRYEEDVESQKHFKDWGIVSR